MFVHWGHSSQRCCELSWPLVGGVFSLPFCGDIPVDEYHNTAKTFNPQNYDPNEWARLAKSLGMQYAILTTKHHDGFAMFHTQQSNFSIQHSPYGKDIVREFIDAMPLHKLISLTFLVSIVSLVPNSGSGSSSLCLGKCGSY